MATGEPHRVEAGSPTPAPRATRPGRTGLAVGVAAVALVAAGTLVMRHLNTAGTPHAAASAPAGTATSRAAAPLPRLATALPTRLVPDPRAAPLSSRPVPRARALAQPGALTEPTADRPVLLLGADNLWRRIDVGGLGPTTDADGNPQPALDVTSLSPDGTRAAFAQRDHVTVVDVATGTARALPVPGYNEDVAWLGDRLLVTQDRRTYLVGLDGGRSLVPYPGRDTAIPGAGTAGDVLALELDGAFGVRLRRWRDGVRIADTGVDGLPPVASWLGPGRRSGGLLARPALTSTAGPQPPSPRVVVVDADHATGRTLATPAGVPSAGVAVLGWFDSATVLVATTGPGQHILAYGIRSASVATVATVAGEPAVLSLAGDIH